MKDLKQKIKQGMPRRLIYWYYLVSAIRQYSYEIRIMVRDKVYRQNSPLKTERDMTVLYHIVEKGLTMPEPRPGFGRQVIINLSDLILRSEKQGFPITHVAFRQSVSVLREYLAFHKSIGFSLDSALKSKLENVVGKFPGIDGDKQLLFTKEDFWKASSADYRTFCLSRHTVRNYTSEPIPLKMLEDCILMAQRSPSFCNRQPSRVHIVKSPEKKSAILDLQNGNRGFGHLADTLLVITSCVSMTKDIHERHENHLNSGMFCMSLIHALHYHQIGSCCLNWSVSSDRDIKVRQLLGVPDSEIVVLVLSCGYVPDKFAVAFSPRLPLKDIMFVHET